MYVVFFLIKFVFIKWNLVIRYCKCDNIMNNGIVIVGFMSDFLYLVIVFLNWFFRKGFGFCNYL